MRPYLASIIRKRSCIAVFAVSVIIVSLVIPKNIFYGYYTLLGVTFIVSSSFLMTCLVRGAKEKSDAMAHKGSYAGIFFSVLGLLAMDACTIGAPMCGATVATGLAALLLPGIAIGFMEQYSLMIIALSLVIQVAALNHMGCFRRVHVGGVI
jgi:hypothetical protein